MSVIYFMRAHNTPLAQYVKWSVPDAPDTTGASSGYNPGDLTGITVSAVSYAAIGVGLGLKTFNFSIDGYLSLIDGLPSIFDAPYIADSNYTISSVRLVRRAAGTSGTTRVNILLNGVSIFASDGVKPQVLFSDGDNATSLKAAFATSAVTAGQRLEAQIETVEGGNPADIRVTITFA